MREPIVPFRQFVLKVASRCDLACDHCYVYEHADQSWRGRPKVMSDDTVVHVAARIAEHAKCHDLDMVHVVMHGGEPLLAGLPRLERISRELHRALDGVSALDLRIHTNGVLLSEKFCQLFESENIKVGVSLDGDRIANDRHRVYASGRSSYHQVTRAIGLLRDHHRGLYAGLLCTMDIRNDPIAVYEALLALEPPRVDFLLPHATWDQPPLRSVPGDTVYADWLMAIHDRWVADGKPMAIRLFDSIVLTSKGRHSQTESLGLKPSDLVVIETDGSYEQADSLKTAYDGAPATGLDVFRHSLDEVARHPGVTARQEGLTSLAQECRACPVVESCGGGLYAHRYRTGSGFMNPSVYCADLFKLIPHVLGARGRVTHALPVATLDVLATAFGGPSEIAQLLAPQRSVTRQMVAMVGRLAGGDTSWALLTRLDRDHRDAVDEVFSHPYVRAWAERCLGRVGSASAPSDVRYLASITAAVAIRAGDSVRVDVPVFRGMVHLPTLGRISVGEVGERARVQVTGGSFAVRADAQWNEEGGPGWEPVRSLQTEGISLLLDDVDLYRDCHGRPVRDRLSDCEADTWQKVFAVAWERLTRDHPEQAAAMHVGLRVITPLAGDAGHGSSARHAYGALAFTQCADPDSLAMLMVREFRRAQLGAVLDMFDLAGGDARVEESLYATYALLAIMDFRPRAEAYSALRRAQATLDHQLAAGLPDIGRRFISGMRAFAAARLDELDRGSPVPFGRNRDDAARARRDA